MKKLGIIVVIILGLVLVLAGLHALDGFNGAGCRLKGARFAHDFGSAPTGKTQWLKEYFFLPGGQCIYRTY